MKKISDFLVNLIQTNSKVNTIQQDENIETLRKLNSKEISFKDYIQAKIKSLESEKSNQ